MGSNRAHMWVFILVVAACMPCSALDFQPPEEGEFFPIGWSENGTAFAFGWFATTIMVTNGSQLQIVIQDLVTDEVIWQGGETWEESNVGGPEDTSPPAPRYSAQAWDLFFETAGDIFNYHDILVQNKNPFSSEALVGGDSLRAEIIVMGEDAEVGIPAGTFYEVYAFSGLRGKKRISGGEIEPDIEMDVAGYVINPQGSRMAVIIRKSIPWVSRYPTYEVIGCHVRAGFEAMPR